MSNEFENVPEEPTELPVEEVAEELPDEEPISIEAETEVAPVVVDPFEAEQELLGQLDTIAANWSVGSLEFGWVAAELWNKTQEDFMEMADGKERKALTLFTSIIHERLSKEIESRGIVSERLRIARYIGRKEYGEIVAASNGYEPTFHQIRNCVFTDGDGLDTVKTNAMLDYAISEGWPPVVDIRAHRGVVDPAQKIDPADRHWIGLVKMSQYVMNDVAVGHPHYTVAKAVLDLWAEENNLKS
jgi:hypothetical protein